MDALALLCTLHADGPATLKRLRARGYPDLAMLIQRSAEELSADLEVEPAYARRLLREAKHLAVRVGAEGLEAEEAPPVATGGGTIESSEAASEPLPPSIPIAAPRSGEQASTLDASDRSLVERIVGQPENQPDRRPEPAPEIEAPPEPGLLTAGSLPGLDSELVTDLHASGIRTLGDLAQAESLQLTRALGITFAQARRLGFLARRAARSVEVVEPVRGVVAPAPALDLPSAPVPIPVPAPAPVITPVETVREKPATREPFWTPRKFLAETAVADAAPEQGVKVDPSEIAPRPRFGDRLAQAAAEHRAATRASGASPAAPKAASGSPAASSLGAGPGQTVLGWNFEIPRPADEPSLPLGSVAVPEETEGPAESTTERSQEYSAGVSVPRDRPKDRGHGGPFA